MENVVIEQDALVCFIDLHSHIEEDGKQVEGWVDYIKPRLKRVGNLVQYCLRRNIHMLNWEYRRGDVCEQLENVKFRYYNGYSVGSTWNWQADYSHYSRVYLCGISIDQCVMRRPCGYIWAPHPNKTVIYNCSFQGPAYMTPIDYVARWFASEFVPPSDVVANQSLYSREFGRYHDRFAKMFDAIEVGEWKNLDDLRRYSNRFLDVNGIKWGDWRP